MGWFSCSRRDNEPGQCNKKIGEAIRAMGGGLGDPCLVSREGAAMPIEN